MAVQQDNWQVTDIGQDPFLCISMIEQGCVTGPRGAFCLQPPLLKPQL